MSLEVIGAASASGGEAALVTVIGVQGSVPRHAGSKMLVRGNGEIVGTVGGGRGESIAIDAAVRCISTRSSRTLTVEMQGTEVEGAAMVCGGTSRLLVEHLPDVSPYRTALQLLRDGKRVLLIKRLEGLAPEGSGGGGAKHVPVAVVAESGLVPAGFPFDRGLADRCLASGKPFLAEESGLFYDPVFPREKLLILGGGHIGQALAGMAVTLDFDTTVADDRDDFAAPGRFPGGVKTVQGPYARIVADYPFDAATYVVIVTRGHLYDLECIRAVLARTYRYAGFIGSTRKAKLLRAQVASDGFDPAKIEALHGPIGLNIAAETPAEIAVSILGEMIAVRRNAQSAAGMGMPRNKQA